MSFEQLRLGHGYNHAYLLKKKARKFAHGARLVGPKSGISLDVFCDLPALQLYTGDFLQKTRIKDGHYCRPRQGLALECEYVPNAINITGQLKPILRAHEQYQAHIQYKAGIVEPSSRNPQQASVGQNTTVNLAERRSQDGRFIKY